MREIEDFLKWFFNQKIIGIDHKNNVLLMGKNGIYIDAYEEYKKIKDNEDNEEKITNFEKIKGMNKEEMADFFFDILHCKTCFLCDTICDDGKCWNVVKQWLEMESDDNDK